MVSGPTGIRDGAAVYHVESNGAALAGGSSPSRTRNRSGRPPVVGQGGNGSGTD